MRSRRADAPRQNRRVHSKSGVRATVSLRWVEADSSHAADLAEFCCTSSGELFQLEVEWFFQSFAFPPDPPELKLLLGYDSVGLVTACAWQFYEAPSEPAMHYVWALARDNRVRGTDYAFRTLEEVLRRCMAMNDAAGIERGAWAQVNSRNLASIELLRRSGFSPMWRQSDDEEAWGIELSF